MNELGQIHIYKDAEGIRLVLDLENHQSFTRIDGLDGTGETFEEALEDLYTNVIWLNDDNGTY